MATIKAFSEKKQEKSLDENRRIIKWNLILFAVLHMILEVSVLGASRSAGARVIIQYLISYGIITATMKPQSKKHLILYTWCISLCVFAVRLLLGVVLSPLFAH